jgi:uncharacterized membrane protein
VADDAEAQRESTTAMQRLLIALVIGAVAGVLTGVLGSWQFAILAGYDAGAIYVVAMVLIVVWRFDPAQTPASATREDDSRFAAQIALLSACVASLGAIAAGLVKAGHESGAHKAILVALCLLTVTLSWLLVHCTYTLRYAHLFYTTPIGGIDFKTKDELPDYRDFAYVAFTVGMTYQVSDTDIQNRIIRHTVLRHALLSFVFGVAILGVVVNVVAGLLG